ncbi:MAG: hypothetical protein ACO2PN_08195 [Pyrobaculum sp.]|jgi:hypothetical protein
MIDFISGIGEKALRFAFYFSILYAFGVTAAAAAGVPVADAAGPLAGWAAQLAQESSFSMSNDVGALTFGFMRYVAFILTFLLSLVTAIYSAASVVASILTAWGFGWAAQIILALAAIVQAVATFYIALRTYILVKSILSPISVTR